LLLKKGATVTCCIANHLESTRTLPTLKSHHNTFEDHRATRSAATHPTARIPSVAFSTHVLQFAQTILPIPLFLFLLPLQHQPIIIPHLLSHLSVTSISTTALHREFVKPQERPITSKAKDLRMSTNLQTKIPKPTAPKPATNMLIYSAR